MKITRKNRLQKQGSALLIVILLITVLATIALGVGRLALAEVKMSTSLEDSTAAYYAAEAGIEDGLLRFRYDRNVETVQDATKTPKIPSTANSTDNVERVDVTSGGLLGMVAPTTSVANPNDRYYDLKIYYRANEVGNYKNFNVGNGYLSSNQLAQDQQLEVDSNGTLDTAPNITVNITYKPTLSAGVTSGYVSIRTYNSDSSVFSNDIKTVSGNGIVNPFTEQIPAGGKMLIKPWGCSIYYAMEGDTTTNPVTVIDSGTTVIESTGYYGSSKRKLVAKIDRQSGTLIGIYDYVLYGGTGISEHP